MRRSWQWRLVLGGSLLVLWSVAHLAHEHVGLHTALAASDAARREIEAHNNLLLAEPVDTLDECLLEQRSELDHFGRRACCLRLERRLQLGATNQSGFSSVVSTVERILLRCSSCCCCGRCCVGLQLRERFGCSDRLAFCTSLCISPLTEQLVGHAACSPSSIPALATF